MSTQECLFFLLSLTILQNWNKFHPEVTELFHPNRKFDRRTDARTLTFTLPCNTFHLYVLCWTYWLYAILFTFICCHELTDCMQYFSPLYVVVNLLIVCNTFHLYMLSWTYWLYAILFTFRCCSELTGCMQYFSPLYVVVNLLVVCNTFHLYM